MLVLVATSVFLPDRLTNTVRWIADNDYANKLRALVKHDEIQKDKLIEMVAESIGLSTINYQPVVILKEKGGELYLPIWIGLLEVIAISAILEGAEVPRPLTADLLCSIIDTMAATVNQIVINDLRDHTFYANVTLRANWV
jgi:hypothetical protein